MVSNGRVSAAARCLFVWCASHGSLCDSTAFLYDNYLVVPLQGFTKANIYETTCVPSYTAVIVAVKIPFTFWDQK